MYGTITRTFSEHTRAGRCTKRTISLTITTLVRVASFSAVGNKHRGLKSERHRAVLNCKGKSLDARVDVSPRILTGRTLDRPSKIRQTAYIT